MSSFIFKRNNADTDLFRSCQLHHIFILVTRQGIWLTARHDVSCSRVNNSSVGECDEIQVKREISNTWEIYLRFQLCSTSQNSLWFVSQGKSERGIRISQCNIQLPELEVRLFVREDLTLLTWKVVSSWCRCWLDSLPPWRGWWVSSHQPGRVLSPAEHRTWPSHHWLSSPSQVSTQHIITRFDKLNSSFQLNPILN